MSTTILIVDDSPTVRKFVHAALGLEGYAVLEAANGMEAIELLPGMSVNAIITDLNMPDMDGLEFLKSLRESEIYRDVPVIVLSSMAEPALQERLLRLGAAAYLVKPFSRAVLCDAIASVVAPAAHPVSEIS